MEYAIKLSLSNRHLESAALLTRCSYHQEKVFSEKMIPSQRSFVTSAVILSVSALEGMINEINSNIIEQNSRGKSTIIEGRLISSVMKYFNSEQIRFKILEKYQIALILAKKEEFEKGRNPYQDAQHLIKLRNALVHYEPSWQRVISATGETEPEQIEKELKGKFSLNPHARRGAFFPSQCMISHGCAEWAVTTTKKFLEEFIRKMDLPPTIDDELLKTRD